MATDLDPKAQAAELERVRNRVRATVQTAIDTYQGPEDWPMLTSLLDRAWKLGIHDWPTETLITLSRWAREYKDARRRIAQ